MDTIILFLLKDFGFTEIHYGFRYDRTIINSLFIYDNVKKLFISLDIQYTKKIDDKYIFYINLDINNAVLFNKQEMNLIEFYHNISIVFDQCKHVIGDI